ncbi:PAS domain-containing protein, partial [Desulfonatronospira sp. MSAO_Bac3]|uniref:PAS domain-containing protein n=1 Tax=Desulfonatronospira sp. MSAO_Bac3 TaxID=2293857 RepID=UPI000FEF5731
MYQFQRRTAASALSKEDKFRSLFETLPQGVIFQDAKGCITSANPAAAKILGISLEQIPGIKLVNTRWKMISEDGTIVPDEAHPSMIALKTGQTIGPVVKKIFNPETNAYLWLSLTAVPVFHPESEVPHDVYTIFEDVTREKIQQDQLMEREQFFTSLFDNHTAVTLMIDPDNGVIIDANHAAAEFYGWSRQ